MKLALQIAAGIVIATLALWVFSFALVGAAAQRVGSEITTMVEQHNARAAERMAQARAREQDAALARLQAQRAAAAAEQQRALELAAVAERRAAKEQAWLSAYRAPSDCEHPPTWEVQVECGNRYMRAKADFDRRWDAGEYATRPTGAVPR